MKKGCQNTKNSGCWLCKRDVPTVEHHIIPRAYGGLKGPTCWICPNCHKNIHAIEETSADLNEANSLILKLFHYVPEINLTKVFLCIKMIFLARNLIKNDPNKTAVFNTVFTADIRKKLKALKSVYPKSSQEKIIFLAINFLYDKHFKNKKDTK